MTQDIRNHKWLPDSWNSRILGNFGTLLDVDSSGDKNCQNQKDFRRKTVHEKYMDTNYFESKYQKQQQNVMFVMS